MTQALHSVAQARNIVAGMTDTQTGRILTYEVECLWGPEQLGAYLGFKPDYIKHIANSYPERLPPRVQVMHSLRWVPAACRAWVQGTPTAREKPKRGRPRKAA